MMRTTWVVCFACCANVCADEAAVREAIAKSMPILSNAARNYPEHRECFSCHHQALPIMAVQAAKRRGVAVNEFGVALQVRFTWATFQPNLDEIRKGNRVPGSNTTAAYALHTLQAAEYPRDAVTDALVQFLLVRQTAEGTWPATTQRPPSEGSKFTTTALALEAFNTYGSDEHKGKIEAARTKARTWLEVNEPVHTEDAVFRLRALVLVKSEAAKMEAARTRLLNLQQADGGWAQLPKATSDAYATGSALIALRRAGLAPTESVYQRGVAYLLKTQDRSGAWLVSTRSKPVQALFDNGDPGGQSQFITVAATGWATLALLELLPVK